MATKTFKIGLSNTDKQNMAQDVYERLLALTFPEYDSAESYNVGDFVVYNDQLYKCIGSTSGAWDSTKWQLATLNDLLTDIESAVAFVNDKANVDGNYPTLTAGLADNLTPYSEDSGAEQDNPFISNGTGTNNNTEIVTVGDYALFKEKQGHTLVVNQEISDPNFQSSSNWSASGGTVSIANNIATFTSTTQRSSLITTSVKYVLGHKYYIFAFIKETTATNQVSIAIYDGVSLIETTAKATTDWQIVEGIVTATNSTLSGQFQPIRDNRSSDWDAIQCKYCGVVDITSWDADVIADLTAHPSHFSWYYNGSLAYNEGSLVNADGVKLVSTGRNLFDGTHDFFVAPNKPYYCYGTATITYKDKDGNTISSESVTNTTFTTPSNCVIVGASGSGQITISPYYTPEEGGEVYDKYYPYEEPYVVDTGSEQLLAFDTKTTDGVWHKNTNDVDLGDLTWTPNVSYQNTFNGTLPIRAKATGEPSIIKAICSKYQQFLSTSVGTENQGFAISSDGLTIYIRDINYNDATAFKTAMSGQKLQYELADANKTTEQGTPFAENLSINDYGMLYWLDSSNNLVGIPQGAKIFYPVNYKGFLDDLYSKVEGNSDDYALNSELNDKFETYLKSLSGYDATATQVLKNVEGTLTWVTEE